MSDNTQAPRKCRWFQFHLSTALAVMLAAGWILYLNTSEQEHVLKPEPYPVIAPAYGWPNPCFFHFDKLHSRPNSTPRNFSDKTESEIEELRHEVAVLRFKINDLPTRLAQRDLIGTHKGALSKQALYGNIVIALILLATLAIFCESITRTHILAENKQ